MIVSPRDPKPPRVSVLIGLVSTEDAPRILETLESLDRKQGEHGCEVILADRRGDALSRQILQRYPAVQLIPCPPGTALPMMRAMALRASGGEIVAVTEDHCVPDQGWLGEIVQAFDADPALAAVGGAVENGVGERGFDWATFLCEYSYFSPPVAEGPTEVLPGMNVAYRRSALETVPAERLEAGFWETTVHPLLLQAGGGFLSRNRMRMFHCKRFSRRLFFAQRFIYSRYYAGLRFGTGRWGPRLAATVASLALPPVLLLRIIQSATRKQLKRELVRALPALAALVVVWSVGEMWGYLFGPGDALAQIE
jgi:hypothetical protein